MKTPRLPPSRIPENLRAFSEAQARLKEVDWTKPLTEQQQRDMKLMTFQNRHAYAAWTMALKQLGYSAIILLLTGCSAPFRKAPVSPVARTASRAAPTPRASMMMVEVPPVTLPSYRLYGAPGRKYVLEVATSLSPPDWCVVWSGIMPPGMETNMVFENVPVSSTLYLRHGVFPADKP